MVCVCPPLSLPDSRSLYLSVKHSRGSSRPRRQQVLVDSGGRAVEEGSDLVGLVHTRLDVVEQGSNLRVLGDGGGAEAADGDALYEWELGGHGAEPPLHSSPGPVEDLIEPLLGLSEQLPLVTDDQNAVLARVGRVAVDEVRLAARVMDNVLLPKLQDTRVVPHVGIMMAT